MNNGLAVQLSEENSVFVVGPADFDPHPLSLAGRPAGKFHLHVVARIVGSQAAPRHQFIVGRHSRIGLRKSLREPIITWLNM
jgi:hypothetical protein